MKKLSVRTIKEWHLFLTVDLLIFVFYNYLVDFCKTSRLIKIFFFIPISGANIQDKPLGMSGVTTSSNSSNTKLNTTQTNYSSTNSSVPSDSTVTQGSQFLFESHMKLEITNIHTKSKSKKKFTHKKTRNSTILEDGMLNTKEHFEDYEKTIAEFEDKKEPTIELKFNCSNGASIAIQFAAFTYSSYDNVKKINFNNSSK